MLRSYQDIIDRIPEAPLWWDEHGVPRYSKFSPEDMDIYADRAVLARIACQDCGLEIVVGDCSNTMRRYLYQGAQEVPIERWVAHYHYGDPPRHHCPGAGETMNCDDLEIIEAWERASDPRWEWVRRSDLEGPVLDLDQKMADLIEAPRPEDPA